MQDTWTKIQWMNWQKQVIAEEYKDITPARKKAAKQFDDVVRESLKKVRVD